MTDEPRWLSRARPELGQSEIIGRRGHNDAIVGYWREAGIVKRDQTPWDPGNDETPWCAVFLGAVLARAGIAGTRSALARSYQSWGEEVATGEGAYRWASIPLGAVVVLNRPGAGPRFGHVGLAVAAAERSVQLLGGNQDDAVTESWFPKTRIVAVRWPAGEAAGEYLLWSAAPAAGGRVRTR